LYEYVEKYIVCVSWLDLSLATVAVVFVLFVHIDTSSFYVYVI